LWGNPLFSLYKIESKKSTSKNSSVYNWSHASFYAFSQKFANPIMNFIFELTSGFFSVIYVLEL